jgi:hypothetical protein
MEAKAYSCQTSLLKFSARVLHLNTGLAQNYLVGLQEFFIPRLCSQEENYFFLPFLKQCNDGKEKITASLFLYLVVKK